MVLPCDIMVLPCDIMVLPCDIMVLPCDIMVLPCDIMAFRPTLCMYMYRYGIYIVTAEELVPL